MQPGQAMCGCPQSDSNRHLADFKSAASANWAMGAGTESTGAAMTVAPASPTVRSGPAEIARSTTS